MSQVKQKSETAKLTKFKDLFKDLDFVAFLQLKSVAGELESIEAAKSIEDVTEQHALSSEFQRWIKMGKPKPSMPNLGENKAIVITALYREKKSGRERLYAYQSDGSKIGVEFVPVYATRVDQNTGKEIPTNQQQGFEKKFTQDWNAELGQKMTDMALETAKDPTKVGFYVWHGKTKLQVQPEDFNLPYDEIITKYHVAKVSTRG